jgi:hypothetical protein
MLMNQEIDIVFPFFFASLNRKHTEIQHLSLGAKSFFWSWVPPHYPPNRKQPKSNKQVASYMIWDSYLCAFLSNPQFQSLNFKPMEEEFLSWDWNTLLTVE